MTAISQEPNVTPLSNGDIREEHPAFGNITVARTQGAHKTLFQSDLRHRETICLTISEADRTRTLGSDNVHATAQIIQVEMSVAQWGALVSSIGLGTGVPVTIRWRERVGKLPQIPFAPRIEANLEEVRNAVGKLLRRARKSLTTLTDAIETKQGVKVVREALDTHKASIQNAEANAEFAVSSLASAAERVTSQARADIESHILTAQRTVNGQPFVDLDSIAEALPVIESESTPT